MEEKYLTVTEFSIKARVTNTTLYNLMRQGILKYKNIQIGGRKSRLLPESELKKFKI